MLTVQNFKLERWFLANLKVENKPTGKAITFQAMSTCLSGKVEALSGALYGVPLGQGFGLRLNITIDSDKHSSLFYPTVSCEKSFFKDCHQLGSNSGENLFDGERREEAVDDDDVPVGEHRRVKLAQEASLRAQAKKQEVEVFFEEQHPLRKTRKTGGG
jgi:hypothetical protein